MNARFLRPIALQANGARGRCGWGLLFSLWAATAAAQTNPPPITTAQQAHRLTLEDASQAYPVTIRGVVTFYYEDIDELFVQDATDGIFIEIGSSEFSPEDFADFASFVTKLRRDPQADPVSQYLRNQLSPANQRLLDRDSAGGSQDLERVLARSLTDLVRNGPSLYDPQRFAGVRLSAKSQARLADRPSGRALGRLNRLLLEDAYPTEISPARNPERNDFEIRVGQLVEIDGVCAPGGFSPDIIPHKMRLLGTAPMPTPKVVTYEDMAAGREDCRWVQFRGIVRSVGREGFTHLQSLSLAGGGGQVVVPFQLFNPNYAARLVDAEIQVTGVCATHFNRKGQLLGVAVQLSSMDDIQVLKPAPDLSGIPARKINSLLKYAPDEESGHRVKVEGIVTLQQPGQSLFITDETQGLYIQTGDTNLVQPGDRVVAWGFPLPCDYVSPVLQDAEFRKTGTGSPPPVKKIAAEEGFKDIYDATLVEMEATLLNRVLRKRDQILELQSGSFIFHAELPQSAASDDSLAAIPNRSRVRLTGVCLVPADPYRLDKLPQTFRILLRAGADVVLLQRPSWWTAEHALWALAGTLAVFLASMGWVAVLRKQVKAQTKIISQKVQREAAMEERARIARDLHDDLGASLTHIAFQSQVAQKVKECPPPLKEHLREISASAQDSFQALDQIVWVVNPKNDTVDSLTGYMCHFAENFFRGTATRLRLGLPASLPDHPIPTELRDNVFLAVKEALNNVRKHAQASEVVLRVGMEAFMFRVTIQDNGQGFSPEHNDGTGNGLVNMKKRLEGLGGHFELESRPQRGTTIRLSVNLSPRGETAG